MALGAPGSDDASKLSICYLYIIFTSELNGSLTGKCTNFFLLKGVDMTIYSIVDGLRLRRKVRAVVTSASNHFLLIRPHGYAADCWTLPGGGVEEGETTPNAICRELQEELGLGKKIASQAMRLKIRSKFLYDEKHKEKRGLSHDGQFTEYFHCALPAETMIQRQVEEIADVAWFARVEALEAFKVTAQRDIFQKCLDVLGADLKNQRSA